MNNSRIKDTQRFEYENLVFNKIPEVISSVGFNTEDYELSFSANPLNMEVVHTTPTDTEYYSIIADAVLKSKHSRDVVKFSVDLLHLPVYTDLGFKINGKYKQKLAQYDKAKGCSFYLDKGNPVAKVLATNGRVITFCTDTRGNLSVMFAFSGKKSANISVAQFLRALTGETAEELLLRFGFTNSKITDAFTSSRATVKLADAVIAIYDGMFGSNTSNQTIASLRKTVKDSVLTAKYFGVNNGSFERFKRSQAFTNRAVGKILTEDINCNGYSFEADRVIDLEMATILDMLPINELTVKHDNKNYVLHKFARVGFNVLGCTLDDDVTEVGFEKGRKLSVEDIKVLNASSVKSITVKKYGEIIREVFTGALTVEDILTIFDIWACNVNGYDLNSSEYEVSNRVLVTFESLAIDALNSNLRIVKNNLARSVENIADSTRLSNAIIGCTENIDVEAGITELFSAKKKTTQSAEMCNILAYASKSNKAAYDGGSSGGNASDDMIKVQDLQLGRFDPFDTPESAQIGKVHYRSVFTKIDEDGNPTVPFLKVVNGEVVSDEPVYLTASDESEVYVAEWNETFKNEDGSLKQTVLARRNGNIQHVPISSVSYKEYSPYQGLSIAHSMVPFPGHSNGKRLTMACNQQKQALPLVEGDRPYVCSGGESLFGFGAYRASDILEDFYNLHKNSLTEDRETVMKAGVKLISATSTHGERDIQLVILGIESVDNHYTLKVPFHLRNTENSMFSYNINPVPNNTYYGDDVICYNTGYSIEKLPVVQCTDFGAQKVDDSIFDSGIALVKNLNIVYKTHGGTTIEDAITLSDKLVYDDSLTHISFIEKKIEIRKGGKIFESFGAKSHEKVEYLGANGLPYIGAMIGPEQPIACKVISSSVDAGSDKKVKYVYTTSYEYGQVVDVSVTNTQDGDVASIWLARRASIEVGDKMAGRCGNKGVVAAIVPECEMPYDPVTGIKADIVLNPLGIPSRQNITQLLEHALSAAMKVQGKIAVVSPYNSKDVDFVREQMEKSDIHPVTMIDGKTGLPFDRPVNLGILPMYKLHHTSNRNIHSVGNDAKLDVTFLQPKKGQKNHGGQVLGEMETWCLESVEAKTLMQELVTTQSDDWHSREVFIANQRSGSEKAVVGRNSNDHGMQAYYRSMGIEFTIDDDNNYQLKPLKDEVIRSFSMMAVSSKSMLHCKPIFGSVKTVGDKLDAQSKWGWIDLKTKTVFPIYIYNGILPKLLGVGREDIKKLIYGRKFLDIPSMKVMDTKTTNSITGMQAVIHLLENTDLNARERIFLDKINKVKDKENGAKSAMNGASYRQNLQSYRAIKDFNESGNKLTDFIITSYPVMPQTYRPELEMSSVNKTADFDWYYTQILKIVNRGNNDTSSIVNDIALFEILASFCGVDANLEHEKHKNLTKFFGASKSNKGHGAIRDSLQSKRVMCSGRAVIKPASDTTRTPRELGVPFTMLVTMYGDLLYGVFQKKFYGSKKLHGRTFARVLSDIARNDRKSFNRDFAALEEQLVLPEGVDAFDFLTNELFDFFEGRNGYTQKVVLAGRQPSLHEYSIRAFKPYITYENLINIHPLMCSGYNADFDGDKMYVMACISQEAAMDAYDKMSPGEDIVSPKDGKIILKHSQDIVLGCYSATMLRNNATKIDQTIQDAKYYNEAETLLTDLRAGYVNLADLIVFNHSGNSYVSTCGRILFNSLVPDGFTNEPFTNTLGLEGLKNENYCELKYDGIVGDGAEGVVDGVKYYNLGTIRKEVFAKMGSNCIDVYQAITEFGFEMSERVGVSLSLADFDINTKKDEILNNADELRKAIETDYLNGLIAEEDKQEALKSLYSSQMNADGVQVNASDLIINDILKNMDRNNNIFIMMDSGARGNKTQVAHMCGCIGLLQKTKTDVLETAVTSNYFEGLSSFDMHLTSYSSRVGMSSTQNETKNSGYATRQLVYSLSGTQIVEEDCGREDWSYELDWGERDADKDLFIPSEDWYNTYLRGRRDKDGNEFDDARYKAITLSGFHSIEFDNGELLTVDVFDMLDGVKVVSGEAYELTKELESKDVLTLRAINGLLRNHVRVIDTEIGMFEIKYKLTDVCKSVMDSRVARGLPGLRLFNDPVLGTQLHIMTQNTIKHIEETQPKSIEMRTTLGCRSKYGVCAHCYGLRYSTGRLPKIGSFVGTEAAQSIAEPASQLTLNVINSGGAAGGSNVASGISILQALLDATYDKNSKTNIFTSEVAPRSGYVKLHKSGDYSKVSIMPKDPDNNEMCARCTELGADIHCECPLRSGKGTGLCLLPNKILTSAIIQDDGEWVEGGQQITDRSVDIMIHPSQILTVGDDTSFKTVHTKRQKTLLNNYFNTFKQSSITVKARHFELLSRLQNDAVTVLDNKDTDFEIGRVYDYNEVVDHLDELEVAGNVYSKSKVIERYSGIFAALSFENIKETAAKAVTLSTKYSAERNKSLISSFAIGEDLVTGNPKVFDKPKIVKIVKKDKDVKSRSGIVAKEVVIPEVSEVDDIFAGITLDELQSLDVSTPVVTPKIEEPVVEMKTPNNELQGVDSFSDITNTNIVVDNTNEEVSDTNEVVFNEDDWLKESTNVEDVDEDFVTDGIDDSISEDEDDFVTEGDDEEEKDNFSSSIAGRILEGIGSFD